MEGGVHRGAWSLQVLKGRRQSVSTDAGAYTELLPCRQGD